MWMYSELDQGDESSLLDGFEPVEPEENLALTVAEETLKTYIARYGYEGCMSAFVWIYSEEENNPLNFVACCKALGLDPGRLRGLITKEVAKLS